MFLNWASNLSFSKKVLILILLPLVAELLLLAVFWAVQDSWRDSERLVIHSKDVLLSTQTLISRLNQVHSSSRGYVITKEPIFREQIGLAEIEIKKLCETIASQVADNPEQLAKVAGIVQVSQSLLDLINYVSNLIDQGDVKQSIEMVRSLKIEQTRAKAQELIMAFLRDEQALDHHRRDLLLGTVQKNIYVVVGVTLGLLFLTVLIGQVFLTAIKKRFDQLMEGVKAFSAGELTDPVLQGNDEIAQLEKTFYQLARSLAERSQENESFIYSVSHDMRSPLVNLRGFSAELGLALEQARDLILTSNDIHEIRRSLSEILEKDTSRSIKYISTAVDRLSTIINSLLQLSRAGRVNYEKKMVETKPIIEKILATLRGSIKEKNVEVSVGPLAVVYGDPTAVEQIFANILSNAIKFVDANRPGKIEVGVRWDLSNSNFTTLYFKDNGMGFPETFSKKLFLPFQRYHSVVTEGEGIGLALVHRVVERHQGKIWAESKLDEGTTFFLSLPNHEPDQDAVLEAAEPKVATVPAPTAG